MARRLLYLSRTWAMGGAQTILLTLIQALPRERFTIVLAPFDSGGEADATFTRAAADAGAEIAEPVRWSGFRDWRGATATLSRLIATEGIDLVHSHDNLSNTLIGLGVRTDRPMIATAFGWWELNAKLKAYYAIERRLVLPRFDAVYTVSHDMAAKIRRGGTEDDRIAVIQTGLDAARFTSRGRRAAVRARLGLGPDALAVGAVGRVSIEKGHEHLLEAVRRLAPRHPGLVAVLGGTGPDVERLKQRATALGIADRLVMPGYVADATEILEALDIAVLPSVLAEGFPTASMEAQAAGLPIVASDIGGTRETLVVGETGFLCPPGDAEALAASLAPLLEDAGLRQRMGAAARRRIAADFTLEGMVAAMSGLYDRVLADDRGARRR